MKPNAYVKLSVFFLVLGALALGLVVGEWSHYDGVYGRYINTILDHSNGPSGPPELRATTFFSITEARLVGAMLISAFALFALSLGAGVLAWRRHAHPRGYAISITLSLALMVLAYQYRWVLI